MTKFELLTLVESEDYPTRDGLYLVERHAELIAADEKSLIVKSRKFGVAGQVYYLITEDRILGEIILSAPAKIDLQEFKDLKDEHRVTPKERKSWWPDKKTFYKYEIIHFEKFDPSLSYNRKPGVQTFQKDVQPVAKIEESLFEELDLSQFKAEGIDEDLANPDERWRELLADLRYLANSGYPRLKQGEDWGMWTLDWLYKYFAAIVDALRSVYFTLIPPKPDDEKYNTSYWQVYRKAEKYMKSQPPDSDEVEAWDKKREETIITEQQQFVTEQRPPSARNYIVLFSGGKDSSATLAWAVERFDKDKVKALFVSMRDFDFPGLTKHVKKVTDQLGVEAHIVKPEETFEEALKRHKEWPHHPDWWCNRELKGKATKKQLEAYDPEEDIVLEGSRKSESREREQKLTSKWTSIAALGKKWRVYRPIMNWSEDQVYSYLEEQKVSLFKTYEMGWDRLSCWGCPRGNSTQFSLLREHYPERFEELVKWEKSYGPIDKDRTAKHKANYGDKLRAKETVKHSTSERTIEFNLIYRSWKGQQVIRGERKGEDWIIMLPLDGYTVFHLPHSPLKEEHLAGSYERVDDEFWNFEGEIPADHPVNPLEELPIKQVILDKGQATILEDRKAFKKFIFKGEKLKGTWAFKKDNQLWSVEKSEGPGSER